MVKFLHKRVFVTAFIAKLRDLVDALMPENAKHVLFCLTGQHSTELSGGDPGASFWLHSLPQPLTVSSLCLILYLKNGSNDYLSCSQII